MVMNKMSSMNGQFNGHSFGNDNNPHSYNNSHLISNGKGVNNNHVFAVNDDQRIEQYKASFVRLVYFLSLSRSFFCLCAYFCLG